MSGSPRSNHSNSSSNRRHRIVELLQENELDDPSQVSEWAIGADFYNEDVADNLANVSSDDDDHDVSDDDEDDNDDDDIHDESDVHLDEESAGENSLMEDEDLEDSDSLEEDPDVFVVAPFEDSETSSDTEEEEDGQVANYDTTLPVGHHYLGENLVESSGRQIFVENSSTNLPLIALRHIVLFPGQVLPLSTTNLQPQIRLHLTACLMTGCKTVGFLSDPTTGAIGTTAEIRNYRQDRNNHFEFIFEGRQRFVLLTPQTFDTVAKGVIKILPELSLGCPIPRINSLMKFYESGQTPQNFLPSKHPRWIYRHYEARSVMKRILDQIKNWYSIDLTSDPNHFSYWVSTNLPISNSDRLKALSFTCAESRLVWLLSTIERNVYLGCASCKNVICHKDDVFFMSQLGPQCSFVNESGFVYDTVTVRQAKGLIHQNNWCNEYSWFPGYAWRLAHCDNCSRHIGWSYKRLEHNTRPKKFFGLARTNVRLQPVAVVESEVDANG